MRAPAGQLGTAVARRARRASSRRRSRPLGTVHLAGETWSARTPDERLVPRDTPVRLVGFDDLTAIVEPDDPAPARATAAARSTDPATAAPAADRP